MLLALVIVGTVLLIALVYYSHKGKQLDARTGLDRKTLKHVMRANKKIQNGDFSEFIEAPEDLEVLIQEHNQRAVGSSNARRKRRINRKKKNGGKV